jgi:hypothetical protein
MANKSVKAVEFTGTVERPQTRAYPHLTAQSCTHQRPKPRDRGFPSGSLAKRAIDLFCRALAHKRWKSQLRQKQLGLTDTEALRTTLTTAWKNNKQCWKAIPPRRKRRDSFNDESHPPSSYVPSCWLVGLAGGRPCRAVVHR